MTPTDETRAVYESMPARLLLAVQAAFELDLADARPEGEAFVAGRLALIASILAERETKTP